jgi:hypothetical protein
MTSENDTEEIEEMRALFEAGTPEFLTTPALGDRALVGAARRRVRTRVFGGTGAVAVVAVGALAIGPLAGWGGHGSGADGAASGGPGANHTQYVETPKEKAAYQVETALKSGHIDSFMGVSLSDVDGKPSPAARYDANPIIVYRKQTGDPTLETDALKAAAPFQVVFRNSVLDNSEQWVLGQRMESDLGGYWKQQGVLFLTSLETDGTITVWAADPAKILPQIEKRYGYDGRVFRGHAEPQMPAHPGDKPAAPPPTSAGH